MSYCDINETSQETLKRFSRDISRESQENLIEISMIFQWDVNEMSDWYFWKNILSAEVVITGLVVVKVVWLGQGGTQLVPPCPIFIF